MKRMFNSNFPKLLWPDDIRQLRRVPEEKSGIQLDVAGLLDLLWEQFSLAEEDRPLMVALDGRAASGKTELALALAAQLPGTTAIHMDDYFLPPERKTIPRLSFPGGNIDSERFEAEVLQPVASGLSIRTRRWDCKGETFGAWRTIEPGSILICEGSYSYAPQLASYYDVAVFCDITAALQRERILQRNGTEGWKQFARNWIPLEEYYIRWTRLRHRCPWYIEGP